jgi:hypothetical protein
MVRAVVAFLRGAWAFLEEVPFCVLDGDDELFFLLAEEALDFFFGAGEESWAGKPLP